MVTPGLRWPVYIGPPTDRYLACERSPDFSEFRGDPLCQAALQVYRGRPSTD